MIAVLRRAGLASGWRAEHDGGAVFRWYERGSPTGHVAVAAWDEPGDSGKALAGHGVWLLRHPSRISVGERLPDGRAGSRFDVPLSACRAELAEDGDALRLTLTARFARAEVVVPLWFPRQCRPHLEPLIDRSTGWVTFAPTEATAQLLREREARR